MVQIKGYEFKQIKISNSYSRRALQYQNNIINSLKVFGLTEDDVSIPLEKIPIKKVQASVAWYMWGEHLFFSYNDSAKFVENLAMVAKVIEHFILLLTNEQITQEQFLKHFIEDKDIIQKRKDARKVMGVNEDSTNLKEINNLYKQLSKKHHPDMPGGDTEKFKLINNSHKILRKELDISN